MSSKVVSIAVAVAGNNSGISIGSNIIFVINSIVRLSAAMVVLLAIVVSV